MSLFLFIPLFILVVFFAFYVPGRVILAEQKRLSKLGLFVVSIILGVVLWGWQGYLFGFLNLRWLSYIYLLIFLSIFIRRNYFSFKIPKVKFKNLDLLTILIIVVGVFGQIIPFLRNGQMTNEGLFISSNNNVDQIWHLTLVEELVRRFPPNIPSVHGIPLLNYHFWFNLVTAEIVRVFHLPLFQTQFNGMYMIISILLGLIAYLLANVIFKSKLFIRLFLFFLYFSGDMVGWFMVILRHRFDLNADWLFENGTVLMDSPGRGFATVISLAGFYLLFTNKEQISKKNIFIVGLLFGSLMGFKIYLAIPLIFGLFCMAFFNTIKKNFSYLFIFIIASIFFAIQFLPLNASSGGLFYLPFNIPREFFVQRAFDMSYIDLRLKIYSDHNNYFRLLEYGILMSIGYLLIQFGVKFFGVIPLRKTVKIIGLDLYVFFYSSLIFSFILGLFFFQKIGGANIWEFFLFSSLMLSILASLNIALYLPKNKIIRSILILLIIIVVIPRWISSVSSYLQNNYFSGFHGISNQELDSYNYLKLNTPQDSTILLIGQKDDVHYSSVVAALTERDLFLSGSGVSQKISPEIKKRKEDIEIIENSNDNDQISSILRKNNINYIYLYNKSVLPASESTSLLREVFSNEYGKIFMIK